MTSDADDLVRRAQTQLDEHRRWLATEIGGTPLSAFGGSQEARVELMIQAHEIKLRVARVSGIVASVVYEYPDDLYKFLSAEIAPDHLRASLRGGHVVDPNQPASSWRRVGDEG